MCNIYNMDETPIWFEMISKNAISKLGEKSVMIRTFGQKELIYRQFYVLLLMEKKSIHY